MTKAEKVVWTEGMFLRPHHFQRTESYLLNYVREWGALQRSYLWGFLDLELDEAMLRQGCIALSYCSGLLPDGTFFQVRSDRNGPAPLKILDNLTNEKVVLALPVRRGGREEVIFSEEQSSLARFITFEQEVEDDNAMSVGEATVQFGRLRLTLMLEKDLTAEWTAIGVAYVAEKRNDNHVRLDNSYIPPMLNANNSPQLYGMINDLHGLLVQRSQQIGGRLRQPGRFNTSEMVEFTLLSLINRHLGDVSHLKTLPLLHPEALWRSWLPFATELATWTPQRTAESILPVYDHDDLAVCFSKLMLMLRQGLSLVMEDHAAARTLPRSEHRHRAGDQHGPRIWLRAGGKSQCPRRTPANPFSCPDEGCASLENPRSGSASAAGHHASGNARRAAADPVACRLQLFRTREGQRTVARDGQVRGIRAASRRGIPGSRYGVLGHP